MDFLKVNNRQVWADAQLLGSLQNVCWQKTLPCVLQIGNTFFSAEKISVKKGKLLLHNANPCKKMPFLTGKSVYDSLGKYLGVVVNANFTSTLKLQSVTLDNGNVILQSKLAQNDDVIIARAQNIKSKTKKKKADKVAQPPKQELPENKNNTVATQTISALTRKRYGDFSFLVGKVVDKTITNHLGEVMIRRGQVVTRQVYLLAKRFGKLAELCLHVD